MIGFCFKQTSSLFIFSLLLFACAQPKQPAENRVAFVDSLNRLSLELLFTEPLKSKNFAIQALQEAGNTGYTAGEADAMSRLGLYYANFGQLDSAQFLHRKSLELRRALGDTRKVAFSLSNLGEAYQEAGLFSEATIALDSSLHLLRGLKDTAYLLKVGQQRAWLERDMGRMEHAKVLFLRNMRLADVWGDPEALATCTKSLGGIYDETGAFDSALHWYNESVSWHSEIEDSSSAMTLWMNMARMYMDQGKLQESQTAMDQALTLFAAGYGTTNDSLMMEENVLLLKLRKSNPDSLINQLVSFFEAQKNYYKSNAAEEMTRLEAAYQLKERQDENNRLLQQTRLRGFLLAGATLLVLLLGLVFRLFFINARNKERMAKSELAMKDAAIERMMQDHELDAVNAALSGQDEERGRIARELHDRLGHILSIAKLNFTSLEEGLQKLEAKNQQNYLQVARMLDEAADEVRRISHDLYGSTVVNFGITTALRQLADAVSASNHLLVQFNAYKMPADLPLETQMNLYRIAGELLSNSIKYAKAQRIDLQLLCRDDKIILGYEDDGKGFDSDSLEKAQGIGYRSIRARLQKINGTFRVESMPGKGMYFEAEVPLAG